MRRPAACSRGMYRCTGPQRRLQAACCCLYSCCSKALRQLWLPWYTAKCRLAPMSGVANVAGVADACTGAMLLVCTCCRSYSKAAVV